MQVARFILALGILTQLIGCAATQTAFQKSNLSVNTQQSDTFFLTPTAPENRKVFVSSSNGSGKSQLDLTSALKQKFVAKGYQVVENPDQAQYLVQANILRLDVTSPEHNQKALRSGYSGAIPGALLGGVGTAMMTRNDKAIVAGATLGGLAGTAFDAMLKDVSISLIADIQISEKAQKVQKVEDRTRASFKNGFGSRRHVASGSRKSKWLPYRTRMISTANKVNLSLNEAAQPLVEEMATAISSQV